MVTSWILNSLTKEIAASVEYADDTFVLWRELEDCYDQTNGAKLYQVQKEINDLTQGALDITGYYTKMKKLWEELNTLNARGQCNCKFICGAKETLYKAEQDRRLIQFLMGLDETYTILRGNIIMMNLLPTVAQAFSLLVQDEQQREVRPSSQLVTESTALNVNFQGNNTNFNTNYASSGRSNGLNYASSNRTGGIRSGRPFCDYCKRPGHTKDKCYKLHGYPQGPTGHPQHNSQSNNYRFNKGKRPMVTAHAASAEDLSLEELTSTSPVQKPASVGFTKEQYEQLVCLFQHLQAGSGRENSDSNNFAVNGSANFAGIIACSTSDVHGRLSCKCVKNMASTWIIDSGASHHMSYNDSSFFNTQNLPHPLLISLPNGCRVKVTKVGSVTISPDLILHKVLYVPSFRFNLIAVSSLTAQLKSLITFSTTSCLLQAPSMKRPLEIGG
ncbi:uncharacterized protein LOC107858017 [Capsicum annuum]|uniref:uncharacterized protein LOC107858017 n=1 Tax=Capsicum annuum TaxID=4072 RepID=UPI001FB08B34|nr:uncharacterized protein LOC107858017 [Capsicum annuum]